MMRAGAAGPLVSTMFQSLVTRPERRPYIPGTYNSIFLRCFRRGTLKTSYGSHNVHKYSRYNLRGFKKSCETVFGFWSSSKSEGWPICSRQAMRSYLSHAWVFPDSRVKFVRVILFYLCFEHVLRSRFTPLYGTIQWFLWCGTYTIALGGFHSTSCMRSNTVHIAAQISASCAAII